MNSNKILALVSFLLLFILFVAQTNSQSPPEVVVQGDKPIQIKTEVTNIGTQPQKNWIVGFDLYKVSGSQKVRDTEIRISYPSPYGMSSPCYNVADDGTRSPIPLELCYCENNLYGDYLRPRAENKLIVTCTLQPLLWQSRLGYTVGNEKINVTVTETEESMDLDKIFGWNWFSDAFVNKNVIINLYTRKGSKVDIEAENRKTDCANLERNNPGEFGVKVTNIGDVDLKGVVITDELWIDEDGNLITSSAPDRHKICTKTFSATITPGNYWTSPTWTMSESGVCDSENSLLKEKTSTGRPFYFHKITVKDNQEKVIGVTPKVDAPFEEQFPGAFTCKAAAANSLILDCYIDDYKIDINGHTVSVPCNTYVDIYDTTGKLMGTFPVPINLPLSEGANYKILAYPIKFHGFTTEFSHFYDQMCALGNTPYQIDSADNPYSFTMYNNPDKRITLFYKQSTYIDLSYDGSDIKGNLRDEDGSVLSSYGMDPTCKGPPIRDVTNNLDVELFYEKNGAWYPIGTTTAFSDGTFSYGWECIPGVDKLKAVYNPDWWSYEPTSSEIYASCDLDVKSVRVYKGSEQGCTATCADGKCSITGVCSEFKNCGDKIGVDISVQNEGSLSYSEGLVKLSLLEINEEDGTIVKKVDRSDTRAYPSGSPQPLSFEIPASDFANMEEGRHLGFSLELYGKTVEGYSTQFSAPNEDQLPQIDNTKIFLIKCCPHIDFSCDSICKAGELCNCTLIYTHDQNEPGKVQLFGEAAVDTYTTTGSCGLLTFVHKNINYNGVYCSKLDNGDSVTVKFRPSTGGILKLNVYARGWDLSKDDITFGPNNCFYSLDPSPNDYDSCDGIETDFNDIFECNKKLVTVLVDFPETIQPDLVINDIFSTDGKIMYEIANQGSAAAFPSSSGLYINDGFVTTHYDGLIMAGEVKQFSFPGVDWKSYCSKPEDSIKIKVLADFYNDVLESNEEKNYKEETISCGQALGPEKCGNFIDDNGDGLTDCEDPYCRGVLTPIGRCCIPDQPGSIVSSDCTATDSDDGNNPTEKGICTPYECPSNVCRAGIQKIDSCQSTTNLREFYPDPSQPNSCKYDSVDCPDGSYCYDGACIPKEYHPEKCDNFIDDDGDGTIDCEDADCWGEVGWLGLTCCGGSYPEGYCKAVDTDGGYDPAETGTCVPYACTKNVCQADLSRMKDDQCDRQDTNYVYEQYPDPTYPYNCLEEHIKCTSGICDDGRCIGCQGQVELNLIPDEVYINKPFTFLGTGLFGCNEKIIHFREGSCDGAEKTSCTIGSDGNGCYVKYPNAPGSVNTYTYFACVDKNGDGSFSPDEQDFADLRVTLECAYSLGISPKDQTVTNVISNTWDVTAKDDSVVSCTDLHYNVESSTSGDCMSTSAPSGFDIPNIGGSYYFQVYVETTGARPCELTLNVISPKGTVVDTGKYKVCGPEVCNDGIDNDCDDKIDCADTSDCSGQTGPGGVMCCNGVPCSAKDTDGNDIYTKGICTQYNCLSYQCAFDKMFVDECVDASTVKEFEASGTSCSEYHYSCGPNEYCYDGKCIPIACTGSIGLTLIPSTAYPNDEITATTSGLSGCTGKTVIFAEDSCKGTSIGACNVNDGGCSINFDAPSRIGTHTYYACINKNENAGDKDYDDPGEQASATLEVTNPPKAVYILTIDPSNPSPFRSNTNNRYPLDVTATDHSLNVEGQIIYLIVEDKPGCGAGTGVTPNPFNVNKDGITILSATVVRTSQPCELGIRIIAPDGTQVATGDYKVCMESESPNYCNDGIDNDCDGYIDCEDSDCWGTSITKDGVTTWCCGGSSPDQHCGGSNKCDDTASNQPLGGGKCTDWYCDVNEYVCKSNTYTDTCGGDADYPSVTYYECSDSKCNANTNTKSDSCNFQTDINCRAEDWDCIIQSNGAGYLQSTTSSGQDASCVDPISKHSVRNWACKATDGSMIDSCMPEDTDCMEVDKCYCDPSIRDCVGCNSDQICQNYQCIGLDCTGACESLNWLPTTGQCKDSCSIDEVDITAAGYKVPVCDNNNNKHCCCIMPCNITSPAWWCAFDSCGYADQCGYTYGNIKPLYQNVLDRPPADFYKPFDKEVFKVFCSRMRGLKIVMTPTAGADYDLFVNWDSSTGTWDEGAPGICAPHSAAGVIETCERSTVPEGVTTLITVGKGREGVPEGGKYSLSVQCWH